jgi:hypothetical protein
VPSLCRKWRRRRHYYKLGNALIARPAEPQPRVSRGRRFKRDGRPFVGLHPHPRRHRSPALAGNRLALSLFHFPPLHRRRPNLILARTKRPIRTRPPKTMGRDRRRLRRLHHRIRTITLADLLALRRNIRGHIGRPLPKTLPPQHPASPRPIAAPSPQREPPALSSPFGHSVIRILFVILVSGFGFLVSRPPSSFWFLVSGFTHRFPSVAKKPVNWKMDTLQNSELIAPLSPQC